ncbi:hypothetical protein ABFS82_10G156400 [Erythranthe guttata]
MASISSKWKHFTFPFILLFIALLFLATNYVFFTVNYTRQLNEEFQNVSAYLRTLRNPEWFDALSRDLIREEDEIEISLMNAGRFPSHARRTGADVKTARDNPEWFDFVARKFRDERMNIGLVNVDPTLDEVRTRAEMVEVRFERVGEEVKWSDLAPERIDANSTCPVIPMPIFEDYRDLDVVVARVSSCGGGGGGGGGLRDVLRLQVNLVVANLVVRSGRRENGDLFVVFVGNCKPMWEIFTCDDLLWKDAESWIFKPELTRLQDLVLLPVGPCQFVPPVSLYGTEQWRRQNHIITTTTAETNHHNHHHRHPPPPREAYVTVLHTSEAYVCGAIVLAQSLILSNTTKDLVLLADDNMSTASISGLRSAGWKIKRIERIRSPFSRENSYNEWNYSKLRIWQLTEYDKLIFIDADLIVNRNMDVFFAYPQMTAAGNYQRHLFNSGLMVVEPSRCAYDALVEEMAVVESYNGGDQGFLNEMYSWWHRLPPQMNYLKVFVDVNDHLRWVEKSVYAVHYTGLKPWRCPDEARDCNWDWPEFRRYASNTAHKMWWRVHGTLPENLKDFCIVRDIYNGEDNGGASSPAGQPVMNYTG